MAVEELIAWRREVWSKLNWSGRLEIGESGVRHFRWGSVAAKRDRVWRYRVLRQSEWLPGDPGSCSEQASLAVRHHCRIVEMSMNIESAERKPISRV